MAFPVARLACQVLTAGLGERPDAFVGRDQRLLGVAGSLGGLPAGPGSALSQMSMASPATTYPPP